MRSGAAACLEDLNGLEQPPRPCAGTQKVDQGPRRADLSVSKNLLGPAQALRRLIEGQNERIS